MYATMRRRWRRRGTNQNPNQMIPWLMYRRMTIELKICNRIDVGGAGDLR
jgi:hypothetical protein